MPNTSPLTSPAPSPPTPTHYARRRRRSTGRRGRLAGRTREEGPGGGRGFRGPTTTPPRAPGAEGGAGISPPLRKYRHLSLQFFLHLRPCHPPATEDSWSPQLP